MSAVLASFWNKGERIDHVASADLAANEIVVIGKRIGVAGADIASGAKGALYVEGVFKMPKASSEAITAGAEVYWDATNKCITATSTDNTKAGFATEAAAAADEIVLVKINA